MRRSLITTWLITALGVAVIGAPCGTTGPFARSFTKGSLVIPMDNCYQKRDGTSGSQTVACNSAGDDGVFRAYGVVYFLLKHNVPVYWAIDNTKGTQDPTKGLTAPDVTVPKAGAFPIVKKLDWTKTWNASDPAGSLAAAIVTYDCGGGSCPFPNNTDINYIGGPFLIDAADAPTAVQLFLSDPDFAQFKATGLVDVHEVEGPFSAIQVRPLVGPPPKIAILNISGPKTSADVMIKYAQAAGFDWTCSGACTKADGSDCDCAGGISTKDSTCTKANIKSTYNITVNNGPGRVYDILCDQDFLPDYGGAAPDFTKSPLLANSYKLLWAPHWESKRATCPAGQPSGTVCGTKPDPAATVGSDARKLADTLTCIRSFVDAGNNLFAECHAIVTLEGGYGKQDSSAAIKEYGLALTQFQAAPATGAAPTNPSFNRSQQTSLGGNVSIPAQPTGAPNVFAEPYMQIGDFAFSNVTGNVAAYLPDKSGNSSFSLGPSDYRTGVQHFLSQNNATTNLDVFTGLKKTGEGATAGAVVYMGGHDYSGQSAGTRIVLNTLFNLGFACADPNTPCSTGKQGICAEGVLKCASAGGYVCVQKNQAAAQEICGNGLDDDCNGQVDEGCLKPECTPGAQRACADAQGNPIYHGPLSAIGHGACKAATQTCGQDGFWAACASDEVDPVPEVCNGLDDNCDGNVDEGALCPQGWSCQSGLCLPSLCNAESVRCPTGFTCQVPPGGGNSTCVPDSCNGAPCPAGQICTNGACAGPCDNVQCGAGATCSGGQCIAGPCSIAGCPSGQVCTNGACVVDPCAGNTCPQGTFCRAGDCVRSCAFVECVAGQTCGPDGFCVGAATCPTACDPGKVCIGGACQDDPCKGKQCDAGLVCQDGACIDPPCAGVICQTGTCQNGQCTSKDVAVAHDVPVKAASSGCGCGSSGPVEVASLAFLLALFGRRKRRPVAATSSLVLSVAKRSRRASGQLGLLLVAVVALGAAGCSSSKTCSSGQTKCGDACVDLQGAGDNCGACGHVCNTGFECVAASCAFPTGNPFLGAVDPPAIAAAGGTVAFTFTGTGFQQNATARITGAGIDASDLALQVDADGKTAKLQQPLDVRAAVLGAAQVRILNPGRLVSNAVALPVNVATRIVSVSTNGTSIGSVRQDALPVQVTATGSNLAAGVVASALLDCTQPCTATKLDLVTTFVDSGHATLTIPAGMAVGTYDLTLTNPGAGPSAALKFVVAEGTPVLASIDPTCTTPTNPNFAGFPKGSFFYPTSVVRVTSIDAANPQVLPSFNDTPLPTQCRSGVDAQGQCVNGELMVTVDMTRVPSNTYTISVVNPGPVRSAASVQFKVAATCP